MSEELVMKLVSFSRDSEVEVSINASVPGTYDVSFNNTPEGSVEVDLALPAGKAWMKIRTSGAKVPAKLMLDFAELAVASLLKQTSGDTTNA
jgi:hypothetical protein